VSALCLPQCVDTTARKTCVTYLQRLSPKNMERKHGTGKSTWKTVIDGVKGLVSEDLAGGTRLTCRTFKTVSKTKITADKADLVNSSSSSTGSGV